MHSKLKHTLVQGSLSEHHNCTKHQFSKKKPKRQKCQKQSFSQKNLHHFNMYMVTKQK